jgi:hypothetical protein
MILVDANILIDILGEEQGWRGWSEEALERAAASDEVAINPIIYAEVSVGFPRAAEFEAQMAATNLRRLPLPYEAGFAAGKAFLEYRRRGGARSAPLPDFYIGAHAAIEGMRLLTRDPSRYASYFPRLALIAP